MFVIIYNNSVILGPMKWNQRRFQSVIEEECEIITILPETNIDDSVITINENIQILPVQETPNPEFNQKIEILHGPFWEFTTTHAISSYIVQPKVLEAVQNELKNELANTRWEKEIAGIKITIQNVEITADTNRGVRDLFVQQYLLMGETETVMWKFPETWLNLTKQDLGLIVGSGANHVKQAFEWEQSLVNQIDLCTTLSELDALVLT